MKLNKQYERKRNARFIQKLQEYKKLTFEELQQVNLKGLSNTDKTAYNYILLEQLNKQK